jgi:hypothetical protein
MMARKRVESGRWSEVQVAMDRRYAYLMALVSALGLAAAYVVAPGRPDLILSAGAGATFATAAGIAGYEVVRRGSAVSPVKGLQLFLAVMAGKVLAFPVFLLLIAFSTQLNLAALAVGLAGATVMAEVLTVAGLRRSGPGSRASDAAVHRRGGARRPEEAGQGETGD